MSSISRRLSGANSAGEAGVLEVAAEQGADPRAGDAKRVAGVVVVGQHEDVAEQFAHRTGFDLAAVRRARIAAFRVPIGEKLATRWVFHARSSSPAGLGGTHLSRFCARAVPCSLCRTGFAASMPGTAIWPREAWLCVVNVKLTMGWRSRCGVRRVERIRQRRLSPGITGAVGTQVASNSLVIAREGWGCDPGSGAKRPARQGRTFSASSLFFLQLRCSCPGRGAAPLAVHRRAGTTCRVRRSPGSRLCVASLRAAPRPGHGWLRLCTCTGRAKPPIWAKMLPKPPC